MDSIYKTYDVVAGIDFEGFPTSGNNKIVTDFEIIISDGDSIEKIYDDTDIIQKVY